MGLVYHFAAAGNLNQVLVSLARNTEDYFTDPDPATPLIVAIQKGHYVLAAELLSSNPGGVVQRFISRRELKSGNTALFEAAKAGKTELVRSILAMGAQQTANALGRTPLFIAAGSGHLGVVRCLLADNGCNLEASYNGVTPLLWAAQEGHVSIVQELLAHLAKNPEELRRVVDTQWMSGDSGGVSGETALFQAVALFRVEVVRCLVKSGARLVPRRDGRTPLWVAADYGRSDLVEILLNSPSVDESINTVDEDTKTTALAIAAQKGHLEAVKLLLARAGHVFSGDQHPLWLAVKNGCESVVRYLCTGDYPQKAELLAAINTRFTRRGITPFYQAVSEGHGHIAKCLLDAGAEYLAATDQTTPLWAAAKNGHTLLVQHLLGDVGEWGIQERVVGVLDAPSKAGATALYMAASHNHEQIVIRLLAAGAGQVPMCDRTTPLWIAAYHGHVQIVGHLLKAAAPYLPRVDGTTPLQAAMQSGHREVIGLFLKQDKPEILAEVRSYTPHIAGRDSVMLARLLELGVNVNARNDKSKSAMTCALEQSDFAAVALLLIYGAEISRSEAALIAVHKEAVTDQICGITRASQSPEFKKQVLNLIQRIGVCPDGAVPVDPLLKQAFFKPRGFFNIAPSVDNPKSEVSKLKELQGQIQNWLQQSLAQNPHAVFAAGAGAAGAAPAVLSFELGT